MTFHGNHPWPNDRATATSFESNDKIGLYVADAKARWNRRQPGGTTRRLPTMEANGQQVPEPYWDKGTITPTAITIPYIQGRCWQHYRPAFQRSSIKVPPRRQLHHGGYEGKDSLFASSRTFRASNSPISLQLQAHHEQAQDTPDKGEDLKATYLPWPR